MAIPKGHALIYDHRLIHGSAENHLKELRMTVVCGLIPKQAELLYHYREGNEIAAYHCPVDFHLEHDIQKGPIDLDLKERITYDFSEISKEELFSFLMIDSQEETFQKDEDDKSFFKVYTPKNIAAELGYRVKKFFQS